MKTQFLSSISNSIKKWYNPLIIGLIFVSIGILTFTSKAETLFTLALFFSLSFIVIGISDVFFAFLNRKSINNWGWPLAQGLLTFCIGIFLLMNPFVSMLTLPLCIGFIILFRSVAGIILSFYVKNNQYSNWGYILAFGILGVLISFVLIINPLFGGMAIAVLTGITLITGGILSICISMLLRKANIFQKKLINKFQKMNEDTKGQVEDAFVLKDE